MTATLQKLLAEVQKRPEDEQEQFAARWLADMKAESGEDAGWQHRFERHPEVLDALIAEARAEIARGEIEPLQALLDEDDALTA